MSSSEPWKSASEPADAPAGTNWLPPPPLRVREVTIADVPSVPIPDGIAILFLWVFDRTVTGSLLHRLNQIGPVYFLRGGGILAYDITQAPRMAFGRIDGMIEETEEERREFPIEFQRAYLMSQGIVLSKKPRP